MLLAVFSSMHSNSAESEPTEQDPEALLRMLDLELRQKRVQWQKAAAHHRTTRMMSILSIIIVVIAACGALFFLFSQANEDRSQKSVNPISSDR
jgi:hypothetical protein